MADRLSANRSGPAAVRSGYVSFHVLRILMGPTMAWLRNGDSVYRRVICSDDDRGRGYLSSVHTSRRVGVYPLFF